MSRIGKLPIEIPANVTVEMDGGVCKVKGPKGELCEKVAPSISVEVKDGVISVTRPNDEKQNRALHGLTRALIANMVKGVTDGFSKNLEIVGVGYRAQMNGKNLLLNMGYSHPVEIEPREGIAFDAPTATTIVVSGISRQIVGQVAADVRNVRPPEPYKGKGIRYAGEQVRRKVGKTGM